MNIQDMYTIVSGISFLFFAIIWKNSNWFNVGIKMCLWILAVSAAYIIING